MIDPNDLRAATRQSGLEKLAPPIRPSRRQREPFLRGPIPLGWLISAGQLPGRALHVGIMLWFLAGIRGTTEITIPTQLHNAFGLDRHAVRRGVLSLEKANLVVVIRASGRKPRITLTAQARDEQTAPEART